MGLIALTLVGVLGWYFWPTERNSAWDYVPEDAWYILTTNDLLHDWGDFVNSEVWKVVQHHPEMTELSEDVHFLDSLFADNSAFLNLLKGNSTLISAHALSDGDYDFVYFLEVDREQEATTLLQGIRIWSGQQGYAKSQTGIFTAFSSDDDAFYVGQIGQLIVLTFHPELAQKISDQPSTSEVRKDWDISTKDGFQLYLPSSQFKRVYTHYFTEMPEYLMGIDTAISYLHFSFGFANGVSTMKGQAPWTSKPSMVSQLSFENSSHELSQILPIRTAWATSYHFQDIDSLYSYFNTSESMDKVLQKTSKILGIDVYDVLTSWMGNSAIVAQMNYSYAPKKGQDVAVFLEVDDMKLARTSIRRLENAIERRTPGKLKRIDYKGQVITYPGLSGLFKPFLSRRLSTMTLPYYTFVGDYLALSNDPKTLAHILENWSEGAWIGTEDKLDELDFNSRNDAIQVYFSTQQALGFMNSWLKDMPEKDKTIQVLSRLGIGYLGVEANESLLQIDLALATDISESGDQPDDFSYDVYAVQGDQKSIEWIDDGVYKKFFPGTKLVQIQANTKDGLLHGKYTEYYRNKQIKAIGKYKRGLKTGLWKHYALDGTLLKRERK